DPDVEMIARRYFSFLARCRAKVSVVTGDARVNLAKAPPGYYDILYLDAFTGGAVPFHLLTREALELYKAKLKPGGLMVFHVSANFLDISPVIALSAGAAGLKSLYKEISYDPSDPARLSSEWLAVTDNPACLKTLESRGWTAAAAPTGWRVWTDEYRDVLKALKL
ncbi:MAG: fused MFS/spermidine synthase, partial [Elusimicrobia bacterium]|nr:fused MFS/spermidine synthase [Elusimicrobiota bacterium]